MNGITSQSIVPLRCSFSPNGRHVDEIMTFMPYGIANFKIWIYSIGNIIATPSKHPIPDITPQQIQTLRAQLDAELLYNLNTISMSIFNQGYVHMRNRFVLIPKNINVYYDYITKSITSNVNETKSVFNRVWIENEDTLQPILLLPTGLDANTTAIIDHELQVVGSMNTNVAPRVEYIDIDAALSAGGGMVGGGLHCLIKQSYL